MTDQTQPKIGDRIKVTDTYPSGDVQTREFATIEIGSDGYLQGETLGAYPSTLDRGIDRQVEITKRAPSPEPQGMGALVAVKREGTSNVVLMRVPAKEWRGVPRHWAVVDVDGKSAPGTVMWAWENVEGPGMNHTVLSEGVVL